jgi:F-type H+-transporting ATPase subunit a
VGGHLGSFFKPFALLFPINLLEALSNPATLALRLFGNIFAGTILIGLGIQLAPIAISGLGPVVAFIGSVLVQTLALSFNTFIDLIQSFIFMVLTLAYVAGSMGPVGEH